MNDKQQKLIWELWFAEKTKKEIAAELGIKTAEITKFFKETTNGSRDLKDALADQTMRMLRESKGGCCKVCGYDQCSAALEFHHFDPETKNKNYKNLQQVVKRGSLRLAKEEVAKCVLLCSNCHREVHSGQIEVWLGDKED